ncbi:MAG: type II secretion system protein [Trueperaceae bacterium]|nr:type II secretion system protein [Trueperaceae bacterium]
MRQKAGHSLVELLISMAILGTVLSLASQGIIMALRYHRNQQQVVVAQSKLRSINDALNQEVRSAALGGLVDYPVSKSTTSVSFLILEGGGGAGYQVISRTDTSLDFIADASTATDIDLASEVLLIDKSGNGLIIPISSVSALGSSLFRLNHPSCANTIPSSNDYLIFSVQAVGYDYDADAKILYREDGNGRLPLAFDLTEFNIGYVPDALTPSRLTLNTTAEYKNLKSETVERSYASQVDLPQADDGSGSSKGFTTHHIKDVSSCN